MNGEKKLLKSSASLFSSMKFQEKEREPEKPIQDLWTTPTTATPKPKATGMGGMFSKLLSKSVDS